MGESITIPVSNSHRYVITLPLSVIKIGDRYRKEMGDIAGLAASIEQLGLLQPIGIDSNYRLIFGERRLRALEKLGRDTIPARIVHVVSMLQAEHAENEIRKDFTASEMVAIAKAIEDEIGERRGGDRKSNVEFSTNDPLAGKRTDEIAAEKAGFGRKDTYRQARKVTEEAVPELVEAMDRKDIAISTAAKLVNAPPELQRQAAAEPDTAVNLAKCIRTIGTGRNEWYTPQKYLDAARAVLGAIDLDPASSPLANQVVKAREIFTAEDNGLAREWRGQVWMNPPYSQPAVAHFADKLVKEYEAGNVKAAIALTHNYTDTTWFHRLAIASTSICFTRGRIAFQPGFGGNDWKPASPTNGQAFFYFGNEPLVFERTFSEIGLIVEVKGREAQ